MAKLALRHCTPIKKGTKPISVSIARSLIKQLNPGWSFNGEARGLEQEFSFKNFHETMSFVNAVAWIANTEDHHPDFEIGYNSCKIKLTTHAAAGLTVNDFICAAKIDALYSGSPEGTATAEKTQAILEPRPQTGSIPRPAAKTPELNTSEAEELLSMEIKAPVPEPTVLHEEDELRLDPDDEPTLPHLQNPSKAAAPIVKPVDEPAPPSPPAAEPAPKEDKQPSNQFLKTVILPPGMQSVHHDKDEEATVIAQPELGPDFGDEDIELAAPPDDADEVRTMIAPPPFVEEEVEEEEENPDLMKTMIIRPPLRDEDPLNNESDGDETFLINPKSPGPNKLK